VANAEKEKAIELAVSAIEKQFGKGAVMRLGQDEPLVQDISAISTGSVSLDLALGVGGIPKGRVVEIYGPESSGKTTLTLHIIAEAQKAGGVAAFIDAEHALDVGYARKLGVRTEDLLISQPDTGEQALEICESSSSTRWRHWCPGRSWKARWATSTWAFKQGSCRRPCAN